jgi:hypothetical protein
MELVCSEGGTKSQALQEEPLTPNPIVNEHRPSYAYPKSPLVSFTLN